MYTCSFPRCSLSATRDYCRTHRATDDARVTCLFCKGEFDSLPFYGCCLGCFNRSATVRTLVEGAHPQTDSASLWIRARAESEAA